jgi:glycosyltransferase involved in cell wall biosynthesis
MVVIPARNESGNVGSLVREIQGQFPELAVVVVDDSSGDDTREEAARAGAVVLTLPFNLGIAGAVQAGFRYAAERGAEQVIRLDGDGQHDPRYIPAMLAPLAGGAADLVIGSRFRGEGEFRSSVPRRAGIRIFAAFLERATGYQITDPTSGYVAANLAAIRFFAHHVPDDYPEIETILAAWKEGLRLLEVPVVMRRREQGRSSITTLGSVYYMLAVSVGLLVGVFKRRPKAGR